MNCLWCGSALVYAGTGRKPRFCSGAHKQRHYMATNPTLKSRYNRRAYEKRCDARGVRPGTRAPNGQGSVKDNGYRTLHLKDHPLAGVTGFVLEHRVVLFAAIGPGEHPCHWCGTRVSWDVDPRQGGLAVDHLDGDRLNNARSNLVPSCQPCNVARRTAGNPTTWVSPRTSTER